MISVLLPASIVQNILQRLKNHSNISVGPLKYVEIANLYKDVFNIRVNCKYELLYLLLLLRQVVLVKQK